MKFANFLVVDEKLKEGRNVYTLTGQVIFNIGYPIPVIYSGKGCIGLATVHHVGISEDSTDVSFEFVRLIDTAKKDAYYDLYRNQVSNQGNGDGDYEGSEDIMIPGAVGANMRNHQKRDTHNNGYRRRAASLSDFYDER